MSDNINEALSRLSGACAGARPGSTFAADVQAVLGDHARLQARVAELEAAPAIDVERFRQMLDGWKNSDYPFSYEGQCAQRALDACIADAKALIDGSKASTLNEPFGNSEELRPRPLDDWDEEIGPVLWFCWRDGEWLGEPPYCGSPLDSDWPEYHTHFLPLPPWPANLPGEV